MQHNMLAGSCLKHLGPRQSCLRVGWHHLNTCNRTLGQDRRLDYPQIKCLTQLYEKQNGSGNQSCHVPGTTFVAVDVLDTLD
jgi:hypothetical protein